ncbi:hypothetical protein ACFE04_029078 [Oxalis oulophora]
MTSINDNNNNNHHLLPPPPVPRRILHVTVSQPKLRFKMPKLGFKQKQRNETEEGNNDQNKKLGRPSKSFAKKVGSLLSRIFRGKKSKKTVFSSDDINININNNNDNVFNRVLVDDHHEIMDDDKNEEEEEVDVSSNLVEKMFLVDKALETNEQVLEDEEEKKKISQEKSLSFSFFIDKKAINFNPDSTTNRSMSVSRGRGYNSLITSNGDDDHCLRDRSNSCRSYSPSRMLMGRKKWTMIGRSVRRKGTSRMMNEEKYSGDDDQLCKKRILMGEKCKPLGNSGKLEYDEDGVLLPDDDY